MIKINKKVYICTKCVFNKECTKNYKFKAIGLLEDESKNPKEQCHGFVSENEKHKTILDEIL